MQVLGMQLRLIINNLFFNILRKLASIVPICLPSEPYPPGNLPRLTLVKYISRIRPGLMDLQFVLQIVLLFCYHLIWLLLPDTLQFSMKTTTL